MLHALSPPSAARCALDCTQYDVHCKYAMDLIYIYVYLHEHNYNHEESADLNVRFALCFFVVIAFVLISLVIWVSFFPLLNSCFIIKGIE